MTYADCKKTIETHAASLLPRFTLGKFPRGYDAIYIVQALEDIIQQHYDMADKDENVDHRDIAQKLADVATVIILHADYTR